VKPTALSPVLTKRLAGMAMIVLLGIGLLAPPVRADVATAARAFSDGQAAQIDGNYERAAQSFELAYNIAPSKEALRSAVRTRQLSNQLPRAAMLAQILATRYGDDPVSAKLAAEVIAEAKLKLARIAVTCTPPCTLAIGRRAISLNAAATHIVFTAPGRQALEATFEGDRSVTREIAVRAGDDVTLPIDQPLAQRPVASVPAPRAPSAQPRRDSAGLSPAVAITGAATTLVLATLTVWSGLDTNKAHDAYVASPSDAGWTDGRAKQLRTNLLLGGTGVAGVGTALVAGFWTRWGGSPATTPDVAIAPAAGGLTVSYGGRF